MAPSFGGPGRSGGIADFRGTDPTRTQVPKPAPTTEVKKTADSPFGGGYAGYKPATSNLQGYTPGKTAPIGGVGGGPSGTGGGASDWAVGGGGAAGGAGFGAGGSGSGAGGFPSWGGGAGSTPTVPAYEGLNVNAAPSPEMQSSIEEWKKRMEELAKAGSTPDPNLQEQIDLYKQRMGTDNTQRAMDKASAQIRSQAAGAGEMADAAGARSGRGPGTGAAGIGDAAQAAQAQSASSILLGREQQLDNLLLGGQSIMAAPGQQALNYQGMQNSMYGMNPYSETANLGLAQQGMGLQAYIAQLNAQNEAAKTQAQLYGSPWDWYQSMMGTVGGLF